MIQIILTRIQKNNVIIYYRNNSFKISLKIKAGLYERSNPKITINNNNL